MSLARTTEGGMLDRQVSGSDLVAEVVAGTPHLPEAVCAGHAELFDPSTPDDDEADTAERIAFAVKVCRRCPELSAYRSWLNSLPINQRPPGIVAGLYEGKEPQMTDTDEQQEFNRETASVALELLEMARRAHHDNGIDMIEAFEGLSTDDPTVVLGACLSVVEGAISLGADRHNPAAFDGRLGALRGLIMDALGAAS